MSLREKIENNLAIWLFGVLGTGFLAGIVTYKSIIEIAQLDVIPKSRLEKLEAGCKPETEAIEPVKEVPKPKDSLGSEKLQAQPSPSILETPKASEKRKLGESNAASSEPARDFLQELFGSMEADKVEAEKAEAEKPESLEMRFSEALVPFPEHFDLIRPGMRLSEARTVFPNGRVRSGWYGVDIESGPFSGVSYYALSRGEDPPISDIVFFYRSDEAEKLVVNEVLRRFGGISHNSESLGAVLTWPNINGFTLVLDDGSYHISLRGEE